MGKNMRPSKRNWKVCATQSCKRCMPVLVAQAACQVVCQAVCQAVCQVVCQAACQAVQAQHRTPMTKGPRSKKSTNSPASKLNRPRPLVVVNSIFYFLQEVMKQV